MPILIHLDKIMKEKKIKNLHTYEQEYFVEFEEKKE